MYCAVFMQLPGMVRSQNLGMGRQLSNATRVPAMPNIMFTANSVQSELLTQMLGGSSLIKVTMKEILIRARMGL